MEDQTVTYTEAGITTISQAIQLLMVSEGTKYNQIHGDRLLYKTVGVQVQINR